MAVPEDIVDERARWVVDALLRPDGLPPRDTITEHVAIWNNDSVTVLEAVVPRVRGSRLDGMRVRGDGEAVARLVRADGREWDLVVRVEHDPPHRAREVLLDRVLPDTISIREARPEDNEGILEVCRSTPIDQGSARVTIDPGDDYFAYLRLMEGSTSLVALDGHRPVAVHSAAIYTAGFGGRPVRMLQVLHTRVLPSHAGMGLFTVLNDHYSRWSYDYNVLLGDENRRAGRPTRQGMLAGCGYVSVDNEAAALQTNIANGWKCRPYRVTIPCAEVAATARSGDGAGGWRATPQQAAELVRILNATHEREALFLPYTEASLVERLSRDPSLYSWSNIYVASGAVVGVWFPGQRRTTVTDAATATSVRALVVDYGFAPGHEQAFETVLRAVAHEAAKRGVTHLSVFTSDPSPGNAVIVGLGDGRDTYAFWSPFATEPPTTLDDGMYVDQIAF